MQGLRRAGRGLRRLDACRASAPAPAGQGQGPLLTSIAEALDRLCPVGALGIAVSGGPDSLALLLVAAEARPGRVRAATVDHGLRVDSAAEAAMVAEVCDRLAVPHEVLTVEVGDGSSLQAQARAARYTALGEWAQRHALAAVATAHHADDQAETLLMRLSRGSGADGLAGIREQRPLAPGVALIRPLLGWRKAQLEEIVADAGLIPVADPANHDPRHDRTRVRALLRENAWLDPERLARSAAALAEAAAALDAKAVRERQDTVEVSGASLIYRPSELAELRRRITRLLIAEIRPGAEVRGPDLERLLARLERGDTASLAGVLVRPTSEGWHFSAAPPRRRLHP